MALHGYHGKCWGTMEKEYCQCGGNETKCDFYPDKKKKALDEWYGDFAEKLRNSSAITIATDPEKEAIIDIRELVDDAMKKKDRYVSVLISKDDVHVIVKPLADDPRWIINDIKLTDNYIRHEYHCSECGNVDMHPSPYCPMCGEKLKLPDIE
jgi:rubrerythrin